MAVQLLEDLKRYVGFDAQDVAALTGLEAALAPAFPDVVDAFYMSLNTLDTPT